MRWWTTAVLPVVALLSSLPATGADAAPDFLRDVRPILAEHCLKCHGPDEAERAADLRLDRREAAIGTLPSGHRAIVPEDAAGSELLRRIESIDPAELMPPPE